MITYQTSCGITTVDQCNDRVISEQFFISKMDNIISEISREAEDLKEHDAKTENKIKRTSSRSTRPQCPPKWREKIDMSNFCKGGDYSNLQIDNRWGDVIKKQIVIFYMLGF